LDKILTQAGITDITTKTQINVILSCWSFVVACLGSYMLDTIGRRKQALGSVAGMIVCLYVVGGMIKSECFHCYLSFLHGKLICESEFGESSNKSGIYGTIAFIFLFQGFYAFSITPLTSLYPTEISQYKLRTTGIAIFRLLDSGFG
jgi:MFS family permease